MKPKCIYKVRSDNFYIICANCEHEQDGVKWCEQNRVDFSHGICPTHKQAMAVMPSTSEILAANADLPEHLREATVATQDNLIKKWVREHSKI